VLFDFGASHSFVNERFVAAGGLSATQMARNMIVQIPGSQVRAHLSCEGVPIVIHGVLMTHKYRGCIVVLSLNKSVKPNEEQKVLTSGFHQSFTINTSKWVFRGIS
jgi:hypothetical protein